MGVYLPSCEILPNWNQNFNMPFIHIVLFVKTTVSEAQNTAHTVK